MWVFARRFSRSFWKIAPRGPVAASDGGFGWHPATTTLPIQLADFRPVVENLFERLDNWALKNSVDADQINLLGFSQGAMLAYAINLLYPDRVCLSGALAGYMPGNWLEESPEHRLTGKSFYIAHGTQDETIPITCARDTVRQLELSGAKVSYCEAPVGHKLSANCLNGLEDFFNQAVLPAADQR